MRSFLAFCIPVVVGAQVTGRAPVGARVSMPQLGLHATADSGQFTFASVPDGRWVVEVRSASAVGLTLATVRGGTAALSAVPMHSLPPLCGPDTVTTLMPSSARVTVTPIAPLPGTLVTIVAYGDASRRTISGFFAGEPVLLRGDSTGRFTAIAAVPLDAGASARLSLSIGYLMIPLAVPEKILAKRPASHEALKVAAEFTKAPSDTVTRRIEGESELARDVGLIALGTPPLWSKPFMRPRASKVTSGFASGRAFNGTLQSRHTGVDFRGQVGDPVMASNRGVVALVADFFLAGTAVYVVHGAGLVTAYFHLSATPVAIGDTVRRGQVIGQVGQSGRVTGPHLHWVARYDRTSVDALGLLSVPRLPADAAGSEIAGACRGSD